MISDIQAYLQTNWGLSPLTQSRLLGTILILLALWLVRWLIRRIIHGRFREDIRTNYNWNKALDYAIAIVALFLVGRLWLAGIQSLATYLGLLSAGLAIALSDPISNVAGWLFILVRRPFSVGDRIEIGDHAGDVIDLRVFTFSMLEIANRIAAEQSTGRVIHVPNGKVFKEAVANYSHGLPLIWNEIPVLITFESNWEKAKALLSQIITEQAPDVQPLVTKYSKGVNRRFFIGYKNVTPTVYTRVESSGVLLTLRYMIPPRERRGSEQQIWEAILRAFKENDDIEFAYNTYRAYLDFIEHNPASAPDSHA